MFPVREVGGGLWWGGGERPNAPILAEQRLGKLKQSPHIAINYYIRHNFPRCPEHNLRIPRELARKGYQNLRPPSSAARERYNSANASRICTIVRGRVAKQMSSRGEKLRISIFFFFFFLEGIQINDVVASTTKLKGTNFKFAEYFLPTFYYKFYKETKFTRSYIWGNFSKYSGFAGYLHIYKNNN